jgi:hypothetical protein
MDADRGAPRLVALSLSATTQADSSAPMELVPRFSSAIHDYYVRCPSPTNAITVSMTASTGASSLLIQPTPSPSLPAQTVALSVSENEAIVLAATDGDSTAEYWIRCLPRDMPPLRWASHPEAGAPAPGYYLVGNQFPPQGEGGYALVLDGNGVPVWYARAPTGWGACDVDSFASGQISFIPFSLTPSSLNASVELFEIRQLDPLETTTLEPEGYFTDEHELRILPSGNSIVFAWPYKAGVDLTGLEATLPDGGREVLGPNSTILDCDVVEFSPTGAVVWTWVASQHFDPVRDSTAAITYDNATGMPLVDPFHCNSIDVDPKNGNLLVSARNMDSIFYVARSTGAVLWKIGGAAFSKDNAAFVLPADPFYQQHDARLLPGWSETCTGGSGQISVFDDESNETAAARGVVYDVVLGSPDGVPFADGGCGDGGSQEGGVGGTATVAWQYRGRASSSGQGSVRMSTDGSRIIDWGTLDAPDPQLVFTEVDADGGALVDFGYADNSSSYRAIKVPLTQFDLGVLRRTAGLP